MRDLLSDTLPVADGSGRYRLALTDGWNFRNPSGGVLMTIALRAAGLELGEPAFRVRSATTLFSSAILEGNVVIRARVIRKGAAAAQVHVNLANEGATEPGLDVVATFGRDLAMGPAFVDVTAPDVPRPLDSPVLEGPTPVAEHFAPPIFRNLDVRLALGHPWWNDGWEPGPARICRWMRYGKLQRLEDGRVDPLSLPPLIDTMPPSTIQRLGPGFAPFVAPSLDLTVHFFAPTETEWLLVDTRTRHAGEGYGSAGVHVWDEAGCLLAYGTQMWMFRKAPHVPAP